MKQYPKAICRPEIKEETFLEGTVFQKKKKKKEKKKWQYLELGSLTFLFSSSEADLQTINSLTCNVFFISVSTAWVSYIYCTALLLTHFSAEVLCMLIWRKARAEEGGQMLSAAYIQHLKQIFNICHILMGASLTTPDTLSLYRNFLDLPSDTKCSPS